MNDLRNKWCLHLRAIDKRVVILLVFTSLLFFFNLGNRDLWSPDEPRYSEVAKEMWDTGNYILPHLNSEKYPDKPPVFFWLIILFSLPFGEITELSARMPSAFAGIFGTLITYYFGKRLFTPRIGLIAAMLLSTSMEYLYHIRRVSIDGVLTMLVTLSLFCFYKGYMSRKSGTKFFLISYLLMGIATITKGPVGFVLPVLVIVTFLVIVKIRSSQHMFRLRHMHIGIGSLILFGIPLLWVFGIYNQGGLDHIKQVLFTQNIGRTVNSWSHNHPFYFYLVFFPLYFMPWSILIPGTAISYLKIFNFWPYRIKGDSVVGDNHNADKHGLLFPTVWFCVIFIFFSVVSGKREGYILPLYPAASLLVAWFLDSYISAPRDKRFRRSCYLPLMICHVVMIVFAMIFPFWVYYYHNFAFVSVLPMVVIFMVGQVIAIRFLSSARPAKALITSFAVFLITLMLCTQVVIPLINEKKSAKTFCENVNKIVKPDDKLAFALFFRSTYLFYTGRNKIEVIDKTVRLLEYVKTNEKVYLILKENLVETIMKDTDIVLIPLLKGAVGHRKLVLASNQPEDYPPDWDLESEPVFKDFPEQ